MKSEKWKNFMPTYYKKLIDLMSENKIRVKHFLIHKTFVFILLKTIILKISGKKLDFKSLLTLIWIVYYFKSE